MLHPLTNKDSGAASDPRGRDRRGIEIDRELATSAGVPEDLDADGISDFGIPDTARRRRSSAVYVVAAAVAAGSAAAGLGSGYWWLAGASIVIAVYHVASGRTLEVREGQALDVANKATTFAVGHASATVGFDGFLARPVWNVLLFSADEPPSERGLVRVDGATGEVIETYVEAIAVDD